MEAGASTEVATQRSDADVVRAVHECRRVLADPEAAARWSAPELAVARAVVARYAAAVRPSGFPPAAPTSEATCAAVLAAIDPAPAA